LVSRPSKRPSLLSRKNSDGNAKRESRSMKHKGETIKQYESDKTYARKTSAANELSSGKLRSIFRHAGLDPASSLALWMLLAQVKTPAQCLSGYSPVGYRTRNENETL
jgi:hypothetical protein